MIRSDQWKIILIPKRVKTLHLLAFIGLAMWGCSQGEHKKVHPAFYYWRTHFHLDAAEQQYLKDCRIERLYVKFFDVDWEEATQRIVPLAIIGLDSSAKSIQQQWEITPVIFITNRAIANLTAEGITDLAEKIGQKIEAIEQKLGDEHSPEIQLDCDWTPSTRERYFQLLETLGTRCQKKNVLLSATLRLHQLRYPQKTGVPPVKRGMLMLYNVGEVEEWTENNSIFRDQAARSYLEHLLDYPLEYDVALPAFSWGVLFRNTEMIRLINGLQADSLRGDPRFFEITPTRFRIEKSTYLNGYYLYQGDLLRLEHCGSTQLDSAARLVNLFLPAPLQRSIAIFHFTPQFVYEITARQLNDVFKKIQQP
jgi:hypothetical protein